MHTAAEHVKCDRDIYRETIEKWGVDSQLWMAVEETAELQQSIAHYLRGRCDEDAVAEEIADVMLMAEEMAYVFGRERVIFWLEKKKEVVTKRLNEAEFRASKDVMKDMENEQDLHAEGSS